MTKTIRLAKPVELFGKKLAEVEIKEPTGGLYVKLGEPRVLVYNASGSGYWVEQNDTIKAYLEACVVHELGADLVNLLGLEDVMGLKEALFGFFTDAAAKRAATKLTPSSSA